MAAVSVPVAPSFAGLFTTWTLQPVAIAVAVIAVAAYGRMVTASPRWPKRRVLTFGVGVATWMWVSCGWLQVYSQTLFWVWVTQLLVLLLLVPALLMGGQPVLLARRRGARLGRLPDTKFGSVVANPLLGPLLVPLVSAGLVFGPVAGWAVAYRAVGWLLQLIVLVIGAIVVVPLVSATTAESSFAVGATVAVGVFELLLDAVPGFALRLQTHLSTGFFAHRLSAGWAKPPLADQQLAGAILWAVAELIDLPFLLLMFRQWLRADAREAQAIDTVLDAEAIARGDDAAPADTPWWLSDPRLRDRFR